MAVSLKSVDVDWWLAGSADWFVTVLSILPLSSAESLSMFTIWDSDVRMITAGKYKATMRNANGYILIGNSMKKLIRILDALSMQHRWAFQLHWPRAQSRSQLPCI